MPTRRPLVDGEGFRLCRNLFDDGFIYLEFSQVHFEASPHSVQVRIPIEVWETIRHHGGPDLSLLEKSDADLTAEVEAAVDERIRAHRNGDPAARFGDRIYGSVEDSREDQIAAGISAYKEELKKLRRISDAIEHLQFRSAIAPQ